MMCIFNIFTDY